MPKQAPERRQRSNNTSELLALGELSMCSEREGDIHTITLSGELDVETADRVQRALEAVEATDARSIVVDLSGLTFMDSTGLRLLMNAHARSRADANRLVLLRGAPPVQRVVELCGVDRLLPFAR